VLGVVVVAGASSSGDNGATASTPTASVSSAVTSDAPQNESLTLPASTQAGVEMGSTLPDVQKSALASPVAMGSFGNDVKKVQERLIQLGFAPGPADGYFGELTQQAVWAYKKLVLRVSRDELSTSQTASLITPSAWLSMQDPITIQPRRPEGPGSTHVEIYLPEQVMIVFKADAPALIAHIASGDDKQWCELVTYDTDAKGNLLEEPVERDECGISYTPGGVFKFNRRYEGNRQSPLGGMFNPVYFNYGIAVHGAKNVPLQPASHGCIRIHMELSKTFPGLVKNGNRVYVWGQDGREPESYSRRETLPIFNFTNPDSTTTTSSTTTTTTITPTTTAAKPTTTSVAPVTTATPTATTASPVATPAPPGAVTTAAPVVTTAAPPTPTAVPEPTPVPTEAPPAAVTVGP
jgi:hypothetical protein